MLLLGSSLSAEASTINKPTNPFNEYQKNAEIQKKIKVLNEEISNLDKIINSFDSKYTVEGQLLNEEDSLVIQEYKEKKDRVNELSKKIGLPEKGLFSGKKDAIGYNSFIQFSGTCTYNQINTFNLYYNCTNVGKNTAGGKVTPSIRIKGYGLGINKQAFVTINEYQKSTGTKIKTTQLKRENLNSPLTLWVKAIFSASGGGVSTSKEVNL